MSEPLLEDCTDPEMAIGMAIGAASMCWENIEAAGVFQCTRALEIARELSAYLRANPL